MRQIQFSLKGNKKITPIPTLEPEPHIPYITEILDVFVLILTHPHRVVGFYRILSTHKHPHAQRDTMYCIHIQTFIKFKYTYSTI